jgi:hypothetical protein
MNRLEEFELQEKLGRRGHAEQRNSYVRRGRVTHTSRKEELGPANKRQIITRSYSLGPDGRLRPDNPRKAGRFNVWEKRT